MTNQPTPGYALAWMKLLKLVDVRGVKHTIVMRRIVEIRYLPHGPELVLDGQAQAIDLDDRTASEIEIELPLTETQDL